MENVGFKLAMLSLNGYKELLKIDQDFRLDKGVGFIPPNLT